VVVCRYCVFPLSAGTVDSGRIAAECLADQCRRVESRDYPLVAVIVEPREDNLVETIEHYLEVMPKYTHFQVYHGTKNLGIILDNFKDDIQNGKISLWNLGVDNLTIQGYSALLTSRLFWESVRSERVLIFQTDSITCKGSTFNIEEFTEYDFIGAPLPRHIRALIGMRFLTMGVRTGHSQYFNGGLSYRTRSGMLAVIDKHPWDEMWTEDVWFCAFLPDVGGRLPTIKEARKFSFEAEELTCTPWGLHKPRRKYDELLKRCPAVKKIPYIPSHTDYKSLYLV